MNKASGFSALALLVLFVFFASTPSSQQPGAILYVNSADPTCLGRSPCYTTIQAAVNAAQPRDTIRIQAGTYPEKVAVAGKNNTTAATESDRIVIEADPAAPPGSVVVTGATHVCTNGFAFRFQQSKFITLRGLTITGTGGQAIDLMGGNNQNQAIHIERNRIFGNGSNECNGGITIARGNPDTLIVNNLIYGNGRNGITFIDADGGPHYIVENTIHANQWSGIRVARSHEVFIVNNSITQNGSASGSTGGRFGVSREGSTSPQPQGIHLLNNLVCGNRLGEIDGPALDPTDSGNLTPEGTEGSGVLAIPGCEIPGNVYASPNGVDGIANTSDDDFRLGSSSPAIDRGMDPRTLGLSVLFNPLLEADYVQDVAARPQDGNGNGVAAFDVGALEFSEDVTAPQMVFLEPGENAFVRQTVTVTAQATDNDSVADTTLTAGGQTLSASISPSPPAPSVTAIALWNTTTVGDGVQILTATATDRVGNSASASRSVIVDNTPPDTQITGGPAGEIPQTTVTFSFTGADNLTSTGNLLFAWRLDGGAFASFSTETSATLIGLSEGSHTFEVKARDLAGNEDPSPATRTFTVRFGPAITNIDPSSGIIGTLVTITGANFEPGTTQISFNGVAAVIRTITATNITTTVPPTATTGPLTVTTSRGSASQNFTVPTSQDFTLVISPASIPTVQGGSAGVVIDALPINDFSGLIQMTTGPLPTGVTATFSPANLAPNNHSLLTLSTTVDTPLGADVVEIRASSQIDGQMVTHTANMTLNIVAPGQTVLVGKVLDGDDRPLPNVSIKLGGATLTHLGSSDAAGNLFVPLSVSGPTVFLIDGSPANTATTNYPTIPVTLNIQPAVVNDLGYIPRLRGQPVARLIPFIPGQATIITDPDLPGFKMTIPDGVQIIGWDGQPNSQFSVTTVPIDRSPLPPLVLPPGFEARQTYLFSFGKVGGGVPTGNIPIDTPNDVGGLPGDKVDLYFFNEAPDGTAPNQWEKYGTGTVSADGTTIVTDINPATGLPYGIPRFCCGARTNIIFRILDFFFGGPSGGPRDGGKKAGEPVDVATGFFYVDKTDMVLPGRLPIVITRTYRTNQTNPGPFGIGTSWPFDVALASPPNGSTDTLILVSPGNRQDYFSRQSFTTFINSTSPSLRGAVLAVDTLTLRFKDGTVWQFDSLGRLQSQTDRNGNTITIFRDGQGRVTRITEPAGRALTMNYTGAGIESITDPIGRQVRYSYDALGRLETIIDPAGGVTRYTYDSANRMVSLTDPRGITFLANEYDSDGRVIRQTQADGGVWTFAYTLSGSFVSQTVVTNPRGHATTYRFNAAGYQTSETNALGLTTTFERETGTNLVLSVTDPLKRVTRFQYDAAGNVKRITDPAGNSRNFTYNPSFNRVATITDPLGNVMRFEYDTLGNLTAAIDPLGNRTTIAYNTFGQPVSKADPLGNVTTFTYDSVGNLASIADPLGNTSQRTHDPVSRVIVRTDPRGKKIKFAYDAFDRTTTIIDPAGAVTQFHYDGNGNLLAVTDARGSVVNYTYDSMDRLSNRTDPVGAIETFQYDGMGNLAQHIDRKGQLATFAYDALNRRTGGSYADGTSTGFIYDSIGRLIQTTDSIGGTIANQYDTLDRLVAQITNLGTVSYQYDAISRRTRMELPGQAPVTYGYDAASRLKQVVQGTQVVDLAYDALGRRTGLTLPNGVSTEYHYDAASRLAALIYRNALGVLGDLTYLYDGAGNRAGAGGSFARTLLPDAVPSATYNAANRQLTFGNKTMTFDANGNLSSITDPSGISSFNWDARNRLVSLSKPSTSTSFTYDASGRRIEKISNAQRSQYEFDGVNPVQETSGATVLTNTLTGLGIDEYFTRSDVGAGTTSSLITDALGSPIAVVNSAGVVETEHTYEPFGRTTVSGAPPTNPFQFTGRENDGTDLYYYRARYYHPGLQRFISEDPIGFAAGDVNLYSYVGNNPINLIDALGLFWTWVHETMAYNAAVNGNPVSRAGFTEQDLVNLVEGVAAPDHSWSAFNPWSPEHSMPGATPEAIERFINGKLQEAINRDAAGDRDGAMRALGEGIHAVQDKSAHANASPQGTMRRHLCGILGLCPNPDNPVANPSGYDNARRDTEKYIDAFLRGRNARK